MCGLAGFINRSTKVPYSLWPIHLKCMGDAIEHRGPDDSGSWTDESAGIGLVHRRLSILDISEAGHQPMMSDGERFVIVFNGEIYNHLELRAELICEMALSADGTWRGHSDTETLLRGFELWGVESTLKKLVGMFSIALWDKWSQTLTLARDRLGEKPLYYGWQDDFFFFGSELKALKAHPSFVSEIDRDAIALLMLHSAIPAPNCIYRGIRKLLPGTFLTVSLRDGETEPQYYWNPRSVIEEAIATPFSGSPDDAIEVLEGLLKDAVSLQMIADVPLGAFLSGGVDSSTVVALMQAQSSQPVRTFTIGFDESGYDEAQNAKAVAKHLGTLHTELYVSADQALAVIPKLASLYCEPFADTSQIPTFLVSELARLDVTVSLSGDGGDELFCGYNRYLLGKRLWGFLSLLPAGLRKRIGSAICSVSPRAWNRLLDPLQMVLPSRLMQRNIGEKLHRGARVMAARDPADLYRQMISHCPNPIEVVIGAKDSKTLVTDRAMQPKTDHFVHQMMALDLMTYLPDDILTKVDRAAMSVSLETRVPLLDHRVVEFAWTLPLNYKLRDGVGKWPLRQVLDKYVPKELIDRPKMGFGVPIDTWLRGPLRCWAEELLDKERLEREGYFYAEPIRLKWEEHLSGRYNWQYYLWNILMFQAWLENE